MPETTAQVLPKRHIAKTISYRLISTLFTGIIVWVISGDFSLVSMFGVGELILKPLVYYLHERVWYKWIKFGIRKNDNFNSKLPK